MRTVAILSAVVGFITGLIFIVLNYDVGDFYTAPNHDINFVIIGGMLIAISVIVIFGIAITTKEKSQNEEEKENRTE